MTLKNLNEKTNNCEHVSFLCRTLPRALCPPRRNSLVKAKRRSSTSPSNSIDDASCAARRYEWESSYQPPDEFPPGRLDPVEVQWMTSVDFQLCETYSQPDDASTPLILRCKQVAFHDEKRALVSSGKLSLCRLDEAAAPF